MYFLPGPILINVMFTDKYYNVVFSLFSMTPLGNPTNVVLSRCCLLLNMANGLSLSYYRGNTNSTRNMTFKTYTILYSISSTRAKSTFHCIGDCGKLNFKLQECKSAQEILSHPCTRQHTRQEATLSLTMSILHQ
jgi:hypothetical protein